MGLFSSKSKSKSSTTTTYTDNSTNNESAASLGALSHDNLVIGSGSNYSYVEQGLTGENLESVLGTVENSQTLTRDLFGQAVQAVQKTTETAITETGNAYAESKSELRNAIDAIRPIAMYGMIAAIFYFIFKNKR